MPLAVVLDKLAATFMRSVEEFLHPHRGAAQLRMRKTILHHMLWRDGGCRWAKSLRGAGEFVETARPNFSRRIEEDARSVTSISSSSSRSWPSCGLDDQANVEPSPGR